MRKAEGLWPRLAHGHSEIDFQTGAYLSAHDSANAANVLVFSSHDETCLWTSSPASGVDLGFAFSLCARAQRDSNISTRSPRMGAAGFGNPHANSASSRFSSA